MNKSKFTDEQIAFALKQAEGGTPGGEACRKKVFRMPRSTTGARSMAAWVCLSCAGSRSSKNSKLKRLVADLLLDKAMLLSCTQN